MNKYFSYREVEEETKKKNPNLSELEIKAIVKKMARIYMLNSNK